MIAVIGDIGYKRNMNNRDIENKNPRTRAPGGGRKPMGLESAILRLPTGTLARLDAALAPGERRADALRAAVEREIIARSG